MSSAISTTEHILHLIQRQAYSITHNDVNVTAFAFLNPTKKWNEKRVLKTSDLHHALLHAWRRAVAPLHIQDICLGKSSGVCVCVCNLCVCVSVIVHKAVVSCSNWQPLKSAVWRLKGWSAAPAVLEGAAATAAFALPLVFVPEECSGHRPSWLPQHRASSKPADSEQPSFIIGAWAR